MSIPRQPAVRTWAISLERGARIRDHAFGWGQLVYAESGLGRVHTGHGVWVLPGARALWVPAGVRHTLDCETDLALRSVYFAPHAPPALPDRVTILGVDRLLRALILRLAANAPTDPDPDRHDRLVAVLHDELVRAPREPLALPLPTDRAARKVADRILARPGSRRSLDALCVRCGASRRTVERRFRDQTGIGLGAWRRQARLHAALLHLGQGLGVVQTADAVGYDSPSAFVHAFRQALGTTPGRYFDDGSAPP